MQILKEKIIKSLSEKNIEFSQTYHKCHDFLYGVFNIPVIKTLFENDKFSFIINIEFIDKNCFPYKEKEGLYISLIKTDKETNKRDYKETPIMYLEDIKNNIDLAEETIVNTYTNLIYENTTK